MAPQIQLNQLATISLKRKRTAALLKLGQLNHDQLINLPNLVSYIEDNLSKEPVLLRGV